MFNQLFGNYLVKSKKMTAQQFAQVLDAQKKVRVKLGLIAVSEKLMTMQQADEVNRLQAVMDKRFGDIAVEKGYLTDEQVGRLLGLQGNAYLTFVQALTDQSILTLTEVESALEGYQKENGFTMTDLEAIKSDDTDRIVPIFLPPLTDALQSGMVEVAVRTLVRLIDSDICIDKAYWAKEVNVDKIALQSLDGEHKASLAFGGNENSLLAIANIFAGEEFEQTDLDALDAVGEFINCINGLFATGISSKTDMDMMPPSFSENACVARAENICVMPITIKGKRILLMTSFDEMISF